MCYKIYVDNFKGIILMHQLKVTEAYILRGTIFVRRKIQNLIHWEKWWSFIECHKKTKLPFKYTALGKFWWNLRRARMRTLHKLITTYDQLEDLPGLFFRFSHWLQFLYFYQSFVFIIHHVSIRVENRALNATVLFMFTCRSREMFCYEFERFDFFKDQLLENLP